MSSNTAPARAARNRPPLAEEIEALHGARSIIAVIDEAMTEKGLSRLTVSQATKLPYQRLCRHMANGKLTLTELCQIDAVVGLDWSKLNNAAVAHRGLSPQRIQAEIASLGPDNVGDALPEDEEAAVVEELAELLGVDFSLPN